jgi:hypothetical protein
LIYIDFISTNINQWGFSSHCSHGFNGDIMGISWGCNGIYRHEMPNTMLGRIQPWIIWFYRGVIGYIWVNYNISLTWIVRPFGDDFPYKPWFQGSGEQGSVVIIYPDIWSYIYIDIRHDYGVMGYNIIWLYIYIS